MVSGLLEGYATAGNDIGHQGPESQNSPRVYNGAGYNFLHVAGW